MHQRKLPAASSSQARSMARPATQHSTAQPPQAQRRGHSTSGLQQAGAQGSRSVLLCSRHIHCTTKRKLGLINWGSVGMHITRPAHRYVASIGLQAKKARASSAGTPTQSTASDAVHSKKKS